MSQRPERQRKSRVFADGTTYEGPLVKKPRKTSRKEATTPPFFGGNRINKKSVLLKPEQSCDKAPPQSLIFAKLLAVMSELRIEVDSTIHDAMIILSKKKDRDADLMAFISFLKAFKANIHISALSDTLAQGPKKMILPNRIINRLKLGSEDPEVSHLQIDVASVLRQLLEVHNLSAYLRRDSEQSKQKQSVSDVITGARFQRLSLEKDVHDFSLIHHMKQVDLASDRTLVISYFTIAEVEQYLRNDFIILESIFFAPLNRNLLNNSVTESLCNNLLALSTEGFEWTHPSEKKKIKSRAFLLFSTTDQTTRSFLLNLEGCTTCEEKWDARAGFFVASDTPEASISPVRNHWMSLKMASAAQREISAISEAPEARSMVEKKTAKKFKGFRGGNHLMTIPHFNMIDGFAVDYVKDVMLDFVFPCMQYLMFDAPFMELHSRAETIASTLPLDVEIFFKESISEGQGETAHFLRNWLLYFSLPCLKDIITQEQLSVWALLVHAMHTLLKDTVSAEDLMNAESDLREFVQRARSVLFYGYLTPQMDLALHNLLHLPRAVQNCGALWNCSSFPFIGITNYISQKNQDTDTASAEGKLGEAGIACYELLTIKVGSRRSNKRLRNYRFSGLAVPYEKLPNHLRRLLNSDKNISFSKVSLFFNRAQIYGTMVFSTEQHRSLLQYEDDDGKMEVCKLLYFCRDLEGDELFVGNAVQLISAPELGANIKHMCRFKVMEQTVIMRSVTDIERPIWLVGSYLAIPPNLHELQFEDV